MLFKDIKVGEMFTCLVSGSRKTFLKTEHGAAQDTNLVNGEARLYFYSNWPVTPYQQKTTIQLPEMTDENPRRVNFGDLNFGDVFNTEMGDLSVKTGEEYFVYYDNPCKVHPLALKAFVYVNKEIADRIAENKKLTQQTTMQAIEIPDTHNYIHPVYITELEIGDTFIFEEKKGFKITGNLVAFAGYNETLRLALNAVVYVNKEIADRIAKKKESSKRYKRVTWDEIKGGQRFIWCSKEYIKIQDDEGRRAEEVYSLTVVIFTSNEQIYFVEVEN
jgi:hypothetical protein